MNTICKGYKCFCRPYVCLFFAATIENQAKASLGKIVFILPINALLELVLYPFAAKRGPGETFGENFDFEIRRDHGKISYDRRVSESVDDKSLS